MKGFIELTYFNDHEKDGVGNKFIVNINQIRAIEEIVSFIGNEDYAHSSLSLIEPEHVIEVKETYAEVKRLIGEAQCDPVVNVLSEGEPFTEDEIKELVNEM